MKLLDTELENLIIKQLVETETVEELRSLIIIWSHQFDTNINLLHQLNLKLFDMGYQIYGYKLHRLELEDENRGVSLFAETGLYPLSDAQLEWAPRYKNWCNWIGFDLKNSIGVSPYYYIRITPYLNLLDY